MERQKDRIGAGVIISEGKCTRLKNNLNRKLQISVKCDHLRVRAEKTTTTWVMIRLTNRLHLC